MEIDFYLVFLILGNIGYAFFSFFSWLIDLKKATNLNITNKCINYGAQVSKTYQVDHQLKAREVMLLIKYLKDIYLWAQIIDHSNVR